MKRHLVKTLFLMLAVSLTLAGCADKEAKAGQRANSGRNSATVKAEDPKPDILTHEETDLDRLSRIQDRLRKAGLAGYAVIFGSVEQSNHSMVAIDYALFDLLGDDAVACMIIEAILYQSMSESRISQQANRQSRKISESDILEIDFKAGAYLAKAGFSSDGFDEWLEAKKDSEILTDTAWEIVDSRRSMWFMNGYRKISAQTNNR